MPTPDRDSLSSSLPESLRRHLYTAPRQPFDTPSHVSIPLPPLVAPPDPPHRPLDRHRLPSSSSVPLSELAAAPVHQTTIPSQRPIYSDPVFHTSRSSSLSRIINPPSPEYRSEDPFARGRSWREGEAGPSSLGSVVRASRDPREWRRQHAREAAPALLPRDEFPFHNSWPESDPRQSHSFFSPPRHNSIGRDYPGSIPTPSIPAYGRMSSSYAETRSIPVAYRRSDSHSPYPTNVSSPQYGTQLANARRTATHATADLTSPHLLRSPVQSPPHFPASVPSDASLQDHQRYFSSSSSSTIELYTLPPAPTDTPSPPAFASHPSPVLPASHADAQTPNATQSDAGSLNLNQKRTKTPVACEFCRGEIPLSPLPFLSRTDRCTAGRKLKCDGGKPRCKNCHERHFECRYPIFQRRRGPGKAPKGTRARKRAAAAASTSAAGSSAASPGNEPPDASTSSRHIQPPTLTLERSSVELDALAPEVRQYTSVINLDRYTFEPPGAAPQYPSQDIPRPGEWRETSSDR